MGHDEQNRVVVVHPGSAAEECGLRVGDAVRAVDGVALDGLLTASLAGRESVELRLLRKAPEAFEVFDLRKVAAELHGQAGTPCSVATAFRRVYS